MEQQWNALGSLANSVLSQAAEARDANVGRLREAEAAQGEAAHARHGRVEMTDGDGNGEFYPAQLELPLV